MACMPWLPSTVNQMVKDVSNKAKLLLRQPSTPAVTVLPVKKIHHPKYQGRYNPDLDDYDPRTAPVLEVNPEEVLRAHQQQILSLLARIKFGGNEDELVHYRKVARQLYAEYQKLEKEFYQDMKSWVVCKKSETRVSAHRESPSGPSSDSVEESEPRDDEEWALL